MGRVAFPIGVLLLLTGCSAPSPAAPAASGGEPGAPNTTVTGTVRERYAPDTVPVAGATVTLSSAGQPELRTRTDRLGRYTFTNVTSQAATLIAERQDFQRSTTEVIPGQAVEDILLAPEAMDFEWDNRSKLPSGAQRSGEWTQRIPFTMAHWGPTTVTISSSPRWACGTYGEFYSWVVRPHDLSVHLLQVSTCRPSETRTGSALLSPGEYIMEIGLIPHVSDLHSVKLEHPR
jgi:carboxypeptidase family protein